MTAGHVTKARAMIRKEQVPGRGLDLVDTECSGLVLRVTRNSATWLRKSKTGTVRIGDAALITLAQARDQAERIRLAVPGLHQPKAETRIYEEAIRRGSSVEDALDAAWPDEEPETQTAEARRRDGPWVLGDLIDAYLEWKVPKLKGRWATSYPTYLRHPEFAGLSMTTVAALDLEMMLGVRQRLLEDGTTKRSAAKRVINQFRECMTWGWKEQALRCRLVRMEVPWWDRLTVDYASGKRDHVPTVDELARTLAVAERHRSLGQTEHATGAGLLGALWAVVLTGQRTGALVTTEVASCVPQFSNSLPGWTAVGWPGEVMKSKLPHALPVPPAAWAVIERYRQEDAWDREAPSPWMFPSRRGDGHVSYLALNQLLARLQGLREGKLAEGKADLFALHGIRRWTPHDVRRGIATFLGERRLGGAAAAILDHVDGKAEERERTAPVTRLHYDRAQRLELKAEGMAMWCEAILAAYEKERDALARVPLPPARPRTVRKPAVRRRSLVPA
ncbi:integrase arm-type DNA-binding domain-containing protein [Methylorubrum extorquens]